MNHQQTFEQCKDQEGVCVTCGEPLPDDPMLYDAGHVLDPKSKGGEETWSQCVRCNAGQGNQTLAEWDERGDVGTVNATALRTLVDALMTTQRNRIRIGNQAVAITRFGLPGGDAVASLLVGMANLERATKKQVEAEVGRLFDERPILSTMTDVLGVGRWLAATIVCDVDINKASTVSALWKYAGYAPGFDRMVKGERRPYNARLRTTLYKLATGFIKLGAKSPYRAVYDQAKAEAIVKHPEWMLTKDGKKRGPGHCHNHAIRMMMKVFLQHLWITWRQLEGLPISQPYVHEILGHAHYHRPEDFGWTAIAAEKPNSCERANRIEKLKTRERARVAEKPRHVERAKDGEQPKQLERVAA